MSVFFELGIIILISFIGVVISTWGNLPIPGSVLAMMIFYIFLETKIIKESKVSRVCDFLCGNMALFFIPLNVGIMVSYKLFAHKAVGVVLTIIISTFVGLLCSYGGVVLVGKFMQRGKSNGNV